MTMGTLVSSACSSSGSNPATPVPDDHTATAAAGAASTGISSGGSSSGGSSSAAAGAIQTSSSATGTTGSTPATGNGAGSAQTSGGASSGDLALDGGTGSGSANSPPAGSGDSGSAYPNNVGDAGDGEIIVGPTYTPSPYITPQAGTPAGFETSFTMTSAMSNIYNGDDFTPPLSFSRQITVWVPSQYVDGTASPFMVTSDGFYAGIQAVVQNLAGNADPNNSVPPLTVVGIQNGPNVYPDSERSLEYDTVSDRYWRFVTEEVLPAVLANTALKAKFPNFMLTSDPNGRGGYGCSSGGPAVMGLAWFGDFNRVFSFSGSFVAIQKTTAYPEGAWEYPSLIAAAPLRPDLRVFLEVGQNDNGSTLSATSDSNWVIANQDMAAALLAKGNHYRFVYAMGAGHCDHNARNEVMPDGLVWLWRGYQAN
jgi:enterochelin esterase-like enzyme